MLWGVAGRSPDPGIFEAWTEDSGGRVLVGKQRCRGHGFATEYRGPCPLLWFWRTASVASVLAIPGRVASPQSPLSVPSKRVMDRALFGAGFLVGLDERL